MCIDNLTINGLSPGQCQAIIWTNAGIHVLLIGPFRTNFSEILIETHISSFRKMHLKMSSAKWRTSCLSIFSTYPYWLTWWQQMEETQSHKSNSSTPFIHSILTPWYVVDLREILLTILTNDVDLLIWTFEVFTSLKSQVKSILSEKICILFAPSLAIVFTTYANKTLNCSIWNL